MFKVARRYIEKFLNKSLAPFSNNSVVLEKEYTYHILEAARSKAYVENTGNKADSLHRRIELSYEESIRDTYLTIISSLRKYMRFNSPILAIDTVDWDFYGKSSNAYLHPYTGEKGVNAKFKFIVLSLANTQLKAKLPLIALPLPVGVDKTVVVDFLLSIAKKLFRSIRVVLFDRGFYIGSLIEYLQKVKINYIIHTPKNKAICKYYNSLPSFGYGSFKHTIIWYANQTEQKVKTTILILRDVIDKQNRVWDWIFTTNLKLKDIVDYVIYYKHRWQIETNFRVEKDVAIKSKSTDYLVRYFYFMIRLLLHTIWLLFFRVQYNWAFLRFVINFTNVVSFARFDIEYAVY